MKWVHRAAVAVASTGLVAGSVTPASAVVSPSANWGWSYRGVKVGIPISTAASIFHARVVQGLCTRSFTVKVGSGSGVLVGDDEADSKYTNRVAFVQFESARVAGPYGIQLGDSAARVGVLLHGHAHYAIRPANGFQGGFIAPGPGGEWLGVTVSSSSVKRLVIDHSKARAVMDVQQPGRC